jgi:uncharacterized protein YjdB
MRAAMVTTVESGYNTQLINAFIWRDTLVVAACKNIPAGQPAEQTQLTLKFNSNGHVIYKELTVTVGAGAVSTVPVSGVTVAPTSASLAAGGTLQLTADVQPGTATNRTVAWTSSNPAVASVNSSSGLVTAHTAPGTATITATTADGGFTATCTVTTTAATPSYPFELNRHSLYVYVAGSSQLGLIYPQGYSVTWRSEDEDIAIVSSSGKVVGVAEGTTRIIAEDLAKGKSDACTVTVLPSVILNPFELNAHSLTLDIGATSQLRLTAPEQYTVTWRSLNEDVALVSSSGLVYARAAGTTQIIAEDRSHDKSDACTVTVRPAATPAVPSAISLNHTLIVMNEGERVTIHATISPPSNDVVTWSSSNPASVDVTPGGMVIALMSGSATVTAKLPDGTASATCSVTVRDVPLSATIPDVEAHSATLSFPRLSGTSWYLVHLYRVFGGDRVPQVAIQVNPDGTVSKVINLRAAGADIQIVLEGLTPSADYEADIDVVREINGQTEIVTTMHVAFSTPTATANEPPAASLAAPAAWYTAGTLRLTNLEGYRVTLYNLSGQPLTAFPVPTPDESRKLPLPGGVYLLKAEKTDGTDGTNGTNGRKVFKFVAY